MFLVKNFKGFGMKEASHFLRNTGHFDLAILDRHILRNLLELGVIEEVPESLSAKNYLAIEEKMKDFSNQIGIPFAHLDMLLWAKEAGEVFK
jgi:N-glycosylase/DNA lyase